VEAPDFLTPERLRQGPNDLAKAIGLFVVQIGIAWVAWLIYVTTAMGVAGCGDRCDYDLANATLPLQIWGSLGLLAATLIAALPLGLRGRPTWWAPAIGIVLTVLLSVGTTFAMHVATSAG
jgi:hypothetical protein